MITVIKPIIFAFLKTNAVKELVVKLLEAYAKNTDNTVDDKLVELVKKNLLPIMAKSGASKGAKKINAPMTAVRQ